MMSNLFSRIIIVVTFIPALFVCIYFVPFWNHFLFAICVVAVTFLASREMLSMFTKKGHHTWSIIVPLLAAGFPAATWVENTGIVAWPLSLWWLTISMVLLFIRTVWVSDEKKIQQRLPQLSSSVFVLIYPGFLLSYIVKITSLPYPEASILLFLAAIFANDIAAYLGGKFLGRGKALGLPVSPRKTLVGFIAGFVTSIAVCVAAVYLFPNVVAMSLPGAMLLGFVLGILCILGDLAESTMKRSTNIKDSGVLMGGRGGLMDAIDSLLIAAPVFFYLYRFLTIVSA